MRILLSTTSYQDTPGRHHDMLESAGFEVIRERGPLSEQQMLAVIEKHGGFDGLLNGDDLLTAKVIDALLAAPRKCRVIGKYGIGLDSIDVEYATAKKLPVLFTPGVNHTTVAEHAIGLMIGLSKHFKFHLAQTDKGGWKRKTGVELHGKTLGVVGMGRVGKEVALRGIAMGMKPIGFTRTWDEDFARRHGVARRETARQVLEEADVVSLHLPLTPEYAGLVDAAQIARMKGGVLVVNTGRGGLVDDEAVVAACRSGKFYGYATDVMDPEPMTNPHPFMGVDNILVTPHVGSRTLESVGRQAMRATLNLVNFLKGDADYIQANPF